MVMAVVARVATEEERQQAFSLRHTVFVDEQKIGKEIEFDGLDGDCEHFLASVDGRPVGTLRTRPIGHGKAKIERVAVLQDMRGRHVGVALMEAAVAHLREHCLTEAKLHAQTNVEKFYAKLGFASYGGVFEEDGIPHIAMRMGLAEASHEATG